MTVASNSADSIWARFLHDSVDGEPVFGPRPRYALAGVESGLVDSTTSTEQAIFDPI